MNRIWSGEVELLVMATGAKRLTGSEPILTQFGAATGITLADFGFAYQKDFPTFVSSIRDLIEWAYAVKLMEQYERESAATIIVRDGSLEQHGVNSEFREKLLRYFQGRKTPICGFIKGSKLLSRKQGISCWVIGDWVSKRDLPCFFRVPDKLMRHVYDHENIGTRIGKPIVLAAL